MKGDEILSKEFRLAKIDEHYNGLKKEHDAIMDYFDKTSDLEKKREILRRQKQILDAMMLYTLIHAHELELIDLKDALKQLPNTEEFNALKSYLTKGKEILEEVEPIKKLYADYQENTKRMEDYGFIG